MNYISRKINELELEITGLKYLLNSRYGKFLPSETILNLIQVRIKYKKQRYILLKKLNTNKL